MPHLTDKENIAVPPASHTKDSNMARYLSHTKALMSFHLF